MGINPDNLVKISTYAKRIKKSVTWVHKLIKTGEIKSLKIDGVAFVSIKPYSSVDLECRLKACNEAMERGAYCLDGQKLKELEKNTIESTSASTTLLIETNANNELIQFLNKEEV